MEGNEVQTEPIWADYVTYDEDGFIDGIVETAPEDVKRAFAAYQDERRRAETSPDPMIKE